MFSGLVYWFVRHSVPRDHFQGVYWRLCMNAKSELLYSSAIIYRKKINVRSSSHTVRVGVALIPNSSAPSVRHATRYYRCFFDEFVSNCRARVYTPFCQTRVVQGARSAIVALMQWSSCLLVFRHMNFFLNLENRGQVLCPPKFHNKLFEPKS